MELALSAAPKYYRLYEALRDRIRSGQMQPNEQLPTEDDLCRKYGLSRGTVRRAFDVLSADRLIRREQGRGVFVRANASPALGGFSIDEGPRPPHQSTTVRTIRLESIAAPADVANSLGVKTGAALIHAEQLQVVDGHLPVLHEERFLAESLCPGLLGENLDATPIHWLLIHKYRIPLVRVTHDIRAGTATRAVAKLLSIVVGSPVFSIDRLTFTGGGKASSMRPAVLYRGHCRADHYELRAQFQSLL